MDALYDVPLKSRYGYDEELTCKQVAFHLFSATLHVFFKDNIPDAFAREELDSEICRSFDMVKPFPKDDDVQALLDNDKTIYDSLDCHAAIYSTFRLVYLSGRKWTLRNVRRLVHRSLALPDYKANAEEQQDESCGGGDAIASIDAGVDDMPER